MTNNNNNKRQPVLTNKIDCSEIIPNFLYLGSAQAAKNLQALRGRSISHVLNLAGKNYHENSSESLIYQMLHFGDSADGVDLLSKLPIAFQFIDSVEQQQQQQQSQKRNDDKKTLLPAAATTATAQVAVFVHCSGGVSRSPAIVIAYLMHRSKLSLREAYLLVKSKRPGIKPNHGFMKQLIQLELEMFGVNTITEQDLSKLAKMK